MKKSLLSVTLAILMLTSCKSENNSAADVDETTSEEMTAEEPAPELSEAEQEARKITENLGIDNWSQVEKISFTFNVDRPDGNHSERSWTWMPKQDSVVMQAGDREVAYSRNSMDSTATAADRGFINDSFWLLAPYHLVWDEGVELSLAKSDSAVIAQQPMNRITLTYTGDGGYTPGDAYDFFYDDNYKITEWIFRRGNAENPSMVTTFEDYKDMKGLEIATMHQSPDGNFKLYFTDVSVEMTE